MKVGFMKRSVMRFIPGCAANHLKDVFQICALLDFFRKHLYIPVISERDITPMASLGFLHHDLT